MSGAHADLHGWRSWLIHSVETGREAGCKQAGLHRILMHLLIRHRGIARHGFRAGLPIEGHEPSAAPWMATFWRMAGGLANAKPKLATDSVCVDVSPEAGAGGGLGGGGGLALAGGGLGGLGGAGGASFCVLPVPDTVTCTGQNEDCHVKWHVSERSTLHSECLGTSLWQGSGRVVEGNGARQAVAGGQRFDVCNRSIVENEGRFD